MTKNPKKSTFLLRVEKPSGVVPYGVRVKIKESVQNQLDGQRLTIKLMNRVPKRFFGMWDSSHLKATIGI